MTGGRLIIGLMERYQLYPFDRRTEEDDILKLNENQQTMLVGALNDLLKKGLITDAAWIEKAKKNQLTLSELTWLNTIILSRKN